MALMLKREHKAEQSKKLKVEFLILENIKNEKSYIWSVKCLLEETAFI